jgi:hypothetical protein
MEFLYNLFALFSILILLNSIFFFICFYLIENYNDKQNKDNPDDATFNEADIYL